MLRPLLLLLVFYACLAEIDSFSLLSPISPVAITSTSSVSRLFFSSTSRLRPKTTFFTTVPGVHDSASSPSAPFSSNDVSASPPSNTIRTYQHLEVAPSPPLPRDPSDDDDPMSSSDRLAEESRIEQLRQEAELDVTTSLARLRIPPPLDSRRPATVAPGNNRPTNNMTAFPSVAEHSRHGRQRSFGRFPDERSGRRAPGIYQGQKHQKHLTLSTGLNSSRPISCLTTDEIFSLSEHSIRCSSDPNWLTNAMFHLMVKRDDVSESLLTKLIVSVADAPANSLYPGSVVAGLSAVFSNGRVISPHAHMAWRTTSVIDKVKADPNRARLVKSLFEQAVRHMPSYRGDNFVTVLKMLSKMPTLVGEQTTQSIITGALQNIVKDSCDIDSYEPYNRVIILNSLCALLLDDAGEGRPWVLQNPDVGSAVERLRRSVKRGVSQCSRNDFTGLVKLLEVIAGKKVGPDDPFIDEALVDEIFRRTEELSGGFGLSELAFYFNVLPKLTGRAWVWRSMNGRLSNMRNSHNAVPQKYVSTYKTLATAACAVATFPGSFDASENRLPSIVYLGSCFAQLCKIENFDEIIVDSVTYNAGSQRPSDNKDEASPVLRKRKAVNVMGELILARLDEFHTSNVFATFLVCMIGLRREGAAWEAPFIRAIAERCAKQLQQYDSNGIGMLIYGLVDQSIVEHIGQELLGELLAGISAVAVKNINTFGIGFGYRRVVDKGTKPLLRFSTTPSHLIVLGQTSDIKEKLKLLGGTWNPEADAWAVPINVDSASMRDDLETTATEERYNQRSSPILFGSMRMLGDALLKLPFKYEDKQNLVEAISERLKRTRHVYNDEAWVNNLRLQEDIGIPLKNL